MKKMSDLEFEIFIKEIFENISAEEKNSKIEHNVQIEGADGKRQVDVLISTTFSGLDFRTIIECKNHGKVLDITFVDEFHSKIQDLKASKGVLVSKNGFSKKALSKASRLGITLCTADTAKDNLKKLGFQIPVLVKEISIQEMNPQVQFTTTRKTDFKSESFFKICDKYVFNVFREGLANRTIALTEIDNYLEWAPPFEKPLYMRDVTGEKVVVEDFRFSYKLKFDYYFGYLDELESTKFLFDKTANKIHFIFKEEELFDYKAVFLKYKSLDDTPKVNRIELQAVGLPKESLIDTSLKIIQNATGKSVDFKPFEPHPNNIIPLDFK